MVFRHLLGGSPDVIPGEIDVLPCQNERIGPHDTGLPAAFAHTNWDGNLNVT